MAARHYYACVHVFESEIASEHCERAGAPGIVVSSRIVSIVRLEVKHLAVQQ